MLTLKGIRKVYAAGDSQVQALKGIDLSFRRNEFVSILGPSGCGKTTLLNIIGGLDQYTEGDLVINGRSTREYSDRDWDTYRNHSVGFVFQSYNLIPHQSVLANVELALTLSGVPKAERRRRARAALEGVGLGDQLRKRPNQMSGGQMQRVAIARALVNDPDILMADEPTGALDSETSVQVMELLREVAQDRLVIMVTHNAELAEAYSSRIIRLKDGQVIGDTMPFDAAEEEPAVPVSRRPSMTYGTALGLSLNNLMTKKGRTLLTAFAGSIGIIGIALILSLSTGVQNYIDRVQEDTLSSYPITIEAESVDMSSLVSSFMGVNDADEAEGGHEKDAVYANTMMYDLVNSLASTEIQTNNLKEFKAWLDTEAGLDEQISAIQYGYDMDMGIYARDVDGTVFKSDVTELLQTCMGALYGGDYSSYFDQFGAAYSAMEVWEELLAPQTGDGLVNSLLTEQYDLIYGSWPTSYDEAVLIVNEENEISDLVIYCMGLGSQEAVVETMQKMMAGEELDTFEGSWSYEDICRMTFKVLLPGELYQYDSASGTYTDLSATETGLDLLYNAENIGTTVKIVGILRPGEDSVSAMVTGAVGYTSALTDYLLEKSQNLEILQKQLDAPETDVIRNLPFRTEDYQVSDGEKQARVTEYLESLPVSEQAAAYTAVMSVPDESYLAAVAAQQMAGLDRETIEGQVVESYAREMGVDAETVSAYIAQMDDETLFGYVEDAIREQAAEQYAQGVQESLGRMPAADLAGLLVLSLEGSEYAQPFSAAQYGWLYDNYTPAAVSEGTYEENLELLGWVDPESPASVSIYASTFEDKDAISAAIEAYNAGVEEADRIEYTDYVALLMSSVSTIISAISYVLIAFVSISLVVSSIMIGIITYISVLERTKEIGILRAVGASKRDVGRVFNAETLIVGLIAGLIGVGLTMLLCLPINAIVRSLTGIQSLTAELPLTGAVVLVAISTLLTIIAGLIPARVASRKDPVEALRTE